jgi:hypothetical protein
MRTLTVHSEAGIDGVLRLEIPGLPAGSAEVVVVEQPERASLQRPRARSGLFSEGLPTGFDVDAVIADAGRDWQGRLKDLVPFVEAEG